MYVEEEKRKGFAASSVYETNNDTEGLEVEEGKVVGLKGLDVFG